MSAMTVVINVRAGWLEPNGRRTFTEFSMDMHYLWMLAQIANQLDTNFTQEANFSFTFSCMRLANRFADIATALPSSHKRWLSTLA